MKLKANNEQKWIVESIVNIVQVLQVQPINSIIHQVLKRLNYSQQKIYKLDPFKLGHIYPLKAAYYNLLIFFKIFLIYSGKAEEKIGMEEKVLMEEDNLLIF